MRFVDIIYVDYNHLNRVVVEKNLNPHFSIETLETIEELFILLKTYVPKVLILDWMMPTISGLDALSMLRSEDRYKNLIIIMLTARASKEDMVRALSLGANEYIVKPPHFPEMVARIKALLRQQRAEEHTRMQNQLQSYETLMRGMTHEFNNIFSALKLALQLYEKKGASYLDDRLPEVMDFLDRGVKLVKDLQALSSRPRRKFEEVNLALACAKAVREYELSCEDSGISFQFQGDTDSKQNLIFGNADLIHQVLINLLSNAVHAVARVENPTVVVQVNCSEESGAKVLVRDNGVGMDPEMLKRIGDLFFTTKGSFGGEEFDKRSGTGLGLSICKRILSDHNASMSTKSAPGEGTEVEISFPSFYGSAV